MKHNIRVSGKFATRLQKAENEAKKYKDGYNYLLSVLEGSYRTVRRLHEEINELKAPAAAYGAQGEEITIFMVETIN